ncbi:MAG: hypothetical protein O3B86_13495 [Planctomycetota bacterium]|nr:hypothetical protein [Planctomycetota bacterium]
MVPGYDSRQARIEFNGLTKPDPQDHSMQLLAWAICWPWNLVWTVCVYNPFRYIGAFFLREIQSALFEISNGQFSAIERDLDLDPPPPPFQVQSKPASRPSEPTIAAAVVSTVTADSEQLGAVHAAAQSATATSPVSSSIVVGDSAFLSQSSVVAPTAGEANPPSGVEVESRAEAPQGVSMPTDDDIAEGKSSESHTWIPPEPTAYVPMSDRPLRALKYDQRTPPPGAIAPLSKSADSAADPWFQKQVPGR